MKGLDKQNELLLNRHLKLEDEAEVWYESFLAMFQDLDYSEFEQKNIIDKIEMCGEWESDPTTIGQEVRDTLEAWFKFKKDVREIAGRKFTDEIFLEEFNAAGSVEDVNAAESAIFLLENNG